MTLPSSDRKSPSTTKPKRSPKRRRKVAERVARTAEKVGEKRAAKKAKRRAAKKSADRRENEARAGSKAKPRDAGSLESVATPKQARSEETLRRILEAAERLILERGLANVGISDIVREAGSSVGGFYARFRDKEELLRALNELTLRRVSGELEALLEPTRWEGHGLAEIVDSCLEELERRMRERRRLHAVFLERVAREPAAWQQAVAFRRRLVDQVCALLLTRREEIGHPNPDLAVRFAVQMVFAASDQRALYEDTGNPEIDALATSALRTELRRLVLSYLRID